MILFSDQVFVQASFFDIVASYMYDDVGDAADAGQNIPQRNKTCCYCVQYIYYTKGTTSK